MDKSLRWLLPDGVDELLPSQARKLELARRSVLDLFNGAGFQMIQPPLIEFTDSLLIGLGNDVAAQSLQMTDQLSGRAMALRADVSSQAARIDAHSMNAAGINRLCYVEPVVHAQPASIGASRCPLMAGAEIFGSSEIEADIEVILLMLSTLRNIESSFQQAANVKGLELTLDIGHVGISQIIDDRLQQSGISGSEITQITDALQRKSRPDLEMLTKDIQDSALASLLLELPVLCGGAEVLERAVELLGDLDPAIRHAVSAIHRVIKVVERCFPEVAIYCDVAEHRGYAYHTGLVFAVYSSSSADPLANGGRYDGVGTVFGSDRPATGFNTDLKALRRLFDAEAPNLSHDSAANRDRSIAVDTSEFSSSDSLESLWTLVTSLRSRGEVVILVAPNEIGDYKRRLKFQAGDWKVEE